MSQLDKLIKKMRSRPALMRFEEVHKVLEGHGWTRKRNDGTHVSYVKPEEGLLIIIADKGRMVKREYLARICERLALDSE